MSTDPNILNDPKQIQQMINLLQGLLEKTQDNTENEETSSIEQPTTEPTHNIKTKGRGSVVSGDSQVRENKFLSMQEFHMDKESEDIAKKLYQHPPTKRRAKAQKVTARCRVCGKEESVNPSLLYGGVERFKCNKCSVNAG